MGIEIERKFLVEGDGWRAAAGEGLACRQGYLDSGKGTTVRVRIIGEQAFLTIKGATSGITRSEFEYEIPVPDAESLLTLCGAVIIEKRRYFIQHAGMVWELDVFSGSNTGLVMAEIELETEDQSFGLPEWAGPEVSADPRYRNGQLARHPFNEWGTSYGIRSLRCEPLDFGGGFIIPSSSRNHCTTAPPTKTLPSSA